MRLEGDSVAFWNKNEPVVLKRNSSATAQLAALESLRGTLPSKAKAQLERDIKALKAGIAGEERILFELENSHMDMFVLHDLFLEHNGLTAQIDFLVITLQRIFVLECKNLYGDIEVNSRGEFVRNMGGRREGIYSPITQNQRHIELIHAMKRDQRGLLDNLLFDGDFDDVYRGFDVLANPKTRLKDRYASKDVRDKIIRADQLIETIKAVNNEKGPGRDKTFAGVAQHNAEWFLERHKGNPVDYTARYCELAEEAQTKGSERADKTTPAIGDSGAAADGDAPAAAAADAAAAAAAGEEAAADVGNATTTAVDGTSASAAGAPIPAAEMCCPRCGSPMVLRTAKRGERSGKRFYGCSTYPKCRGIINLDD